jgi:hypothetical protein
MNSPITMSCICGNLEKQILFLAKRLIRVRSVRCFLSIFWVFRLSTSCCSGIRWRWYEPQLSVKNFFIPKGSRSFLSSRNTLSVCLLTYMPKSFHLYGQSQPNHLWLLLFPTKLHISSISDSSILSILTSVLSVSRPWINPIFTFSIADSFFLILKLLLMGLFSTLVLYL